MNVGQDRSGLKLVVNFHRITGQSYLLWNFGQPMNNKLKLVLLIFNTFLFIATVFFSYRDVNQAIEMISDYQLYLSSHKSIMSLIMQISISICYAIMNLFVFKLIMFKGKTILVFLNEMEIIIDRELERKIGKKVIIQQIFITLLLTIPFFLCEIIHKDIGKTSVKNLADMLLNICVSNSNFALQSMMWYSCYVIEEKMKEIQTKFTNLKQLSFTFKQLLIIQYYINKFNAFYNRYLFFIIMLYTFNGVSNLTLLYFDRNSTISWLIAAIFESLTQIFIFCYLSKKIKKSYIIIMDKYEQFQFEMHEKNLEQFNHCLVSRLYSLRDECVSLH